MGAFSVLTSTWQLLISRVWDCTKKFSDRHRLKIEAVVAVVLTVPVVVEAAVAALVGVKELDLLLAEASVVAVATLEELPLVAVVVVAVAVLLGVAAVLETCCLLLMAKSQ